MSWVDIAWYAQSVAMFIMLWRWLYLAGRILGPKSLVKYGSEFEFDFNYRAIEFDYNSESEADNSNTP